jgi:centrosomal protein CEP76
LLVTIVKTYKKLCCSLQILQKDVVRTQEDLEHSKSAERERLFLVYAKQWWREFLQIRPQHSDRLVKIFAQDETGTNRLTCSFVRPIRAGRLIDCAREAARFVSLIAYEKAENVGGGRTEMWSNMHSFLCRNKGVIIIVYLRVIVTPH